MFKDFSPPCPTSVASLLSSLPPNKIGQGFLLSPHRIDWHHAADSVPQERCASSALAPFAQARLALASLPAHYGLQHLQAVLLLVVILFLRSSEAHHDPRLALSEEQSTTGPDAALDEVEGIAFSRQSPSGSSSISAPQIFQRIFQRNFLKEFLKGLVKVNMLREAFHLRRSGDG